MLPVATRPVSRQFVAAGAGAHRLRKNGRPVFAPSIPAAAGRSDFAPAIRAI
jgi:hypothetical protein